jgi:hypothetical protein
VVEFNLVNYIQITVMKGCDMAELSRLVHNWQESAASINIFNCIPVVKHLSTTPHTVTSGEAVIGMFTAMVICIITQYITIQYYSK